MSSMTDGEKTKSTRAPQLGVQLMDCHSMICKCSFNVKFIPACLSYLMNIAHNLLMQCLILS